MPSYHSSELAEMSEAERKRALNSVYASAMRTRNTIRAIRRFSDQVFGSAPTPTQTGTVGALSGLKGSIVDFDDEPASSRR